MGEQLDLIVMRNHARMLASAYARLAEDRPRADGRPGAETMPVAALVLGALSVEVGMKALISRAEGLITAEALARCVGYGSQGHDLQHLYSLLPASSQRRIRRHIEAVRVTDHTHIVLAAREEVERVEDEYLRVRKPPNFETAMGYLGRPFVAWRYGYEHSLLICDATFLEALMEATLSAVERAVRDGRRFKTMQTET